MQKGIKACESGQDWSFKIRRNVIYLDRIIRTYLIKFVVIYKVYESKETKNYMYVISYRDIQLMRLKKRFECLCEDYHQTYYNISVSYLNWGW